MQFHTDQIRLLVAHETQLAMYDASKMERTRQVSNIPSSLFFQPPFGMWLNYSLRLQWVPQDALSAPISCASYSCNSQLVFATFCDGNIGIFDADTLRLRCRVAPSAYLPQSVLNG